jgi:hypothetical protein
MQTGAWTSFAASDDGVEKERRDRGRGKEGVDGLDE